MFRKHISRHFLLITLLILLPHMWDSFAWAGRQPQTTRTDADNARPPETKVLT